MALQCDIEVVCGLINPKPSTKDGLRTLLKFIQDDPEMVDIRWISYALATCKWETASTWMPIEEFGKGKGHSYGNVVAYVVGDAVYHNAYYGRGYVQTTWLTNYLRMGKEIGLEDDLAKHPEKALDPAISYAMMSHGMRKGLYTGVGFSKYLHGEVTDYVNARRIINGTDQALKIAEFATSFEKILRDNIVT